MALGHKYTIKCGGVGNQTGGEKTAIQNRTTKNGEKNKENFFEWQTEHTQTDMEMQRKCIKRSTFCKLQ